MTRLYFEDFKPGLLGEFGPREITRDEIIAFATEFDPQSMHLDEEAARETMLGGLSASGWHTCGVMMRMLCDWFILNSASMGANAIDEVKWLRPVRPGDQLTLRTTILETRASQGRPEMGFVSCLFEMLNASRETVMEMRSSLIMGRRAAPNRP
ncbi:MAG: MaoC family dehydratase [Pseudorhodoplanes sp.]|nr:MAG: MaoC family dehydratase [Pseudorhodoplanes sp.]